MMPGPARTPRLAWAPLDPLVRNISAPAAQGQVSTGMSLLASLTGVHAGALYRWRREGLTPNGADRVAAGLGRHPAEVWGNEWWTTP